MNKNELQAEMKRHGFTYNTLSKALELSENSLWRKINGMNEFTLSEIRTIIKELQLNNDKMNVIFFS